MIYRVLKFILNEPLNKNRKIQALRDYFSWQIGSRLVPGEVVVPFVNDACLLVGPGMTGATGNIYGGLAEFEDMGFLLHFLNEDDLFVDVGANIGSFTILASKSLNALSISIEALPMTYQKLLRNILVNDIKDRAYSINCALGKESGIIRFTTGLDTMNHVLIDDEEGMDDVCEVDVQTLDNVLDGKVPLLIKIDVEGFESPVLEGARKTLESPNQHAVILELNGCGNRYGSKDEDIHAFMLDLKYVPVSYAPIKRELNRLQKFNDTGNTIYIKDSEYTAIQLKLKAAASFFVKGQNI